VQRFVTLAALCVLSAASVGCTPMKPRKRGAPAIKLAVLPAESDRFPRAAQTVTEELRKASVSGVDRTEVSKVSLEVVQLSIECVEPTPSCYAAVGKSLDANRLLFAELSGRKQRVKVKVTLFDVDAKSPRIAQKTFRSEADVRAGVADLVAEATR
jgi:hypothetical protein